jgi:hypothetical protein
MEDRSMRSVVTPLVAFVVAATLVPAYGQEQTEVPGDILAELDYFVGTWQIEGRIGEKQLKGTWSTRWARGKHCLIQQSSETVEGEAKPAMSTGVCGWDPAKKRITHHVFWSDNTCYTLRYMVKSPTEWEGEVTGVGGGVEFTAKNKLVKKGPDEFVYESRNSDGEEIEGVFRKVEARKGRGRRKRRDDA